MAQSRATGPYVRVTWLLRLLSGESSCEWASWFKTQHEGDSWARVPSNFDQADWMMNHAARRAMVPTWLHDSVAQAPSKRPRQKKDRCGNIMESIPRGLRLLAEDDATPCRDGNPATQRNLRIWTGR